MPWERERTVDAVWKYLEDIGGDKPDADLAAWIERFRADKWAAARAYWDETARRYRRSLRRRTGCDS